MKYTFSMGTGSTVFSQKEGGQLVLTATAKGETYRLEFTDCIGLERQQHTRSEGEVNVPTFGPDTQFAVEENGLLTTTSAGGVTVYNRFTVGDCTVTMDTWVETAGKLYDCGLNVANTKIDMTGFQEIGGDGVSEFFPVTMELPNYGYRSFLVLRGEKRYLRIDGGYVGYTGGSVNAHMGAIAFNDDLSWFGPEEPLRTVYSFAPTQLPPKPAAQPGTCKADGELVSGTLRIPYTARPNGAAFLCKGKQYPMAAMLIRRIADKKKVFVDTLSCWESVNITETADGTEFLFRNPEGIDGVGLRILGQCLRAESQIQWSVEAINRSEDYSILWCTYPRLYWDPEEECDLFSSVFGGCVNKWFNRSDCFKTGAYPAGMSFAMPFFALYPTGQQKGTAMYFGIHDALGSYKDLAVCSNSGGQLRFNCKFCAINRGEPANGFRLPGKAVWQQFNGDWFEATEIYRAFVESQCDWNPKAGENGREDVPEWFRDLPFWVMDWMPNETDAEEPIPISIRPTRDVGENYWYEAPIKLQKELGVPIGYHLYNWHRIPFNNDYPHYFPAKNALAAGMAQLRKADIRIMPYINALLWDNRDKENTDWQFTAIARAGAVKREDGSVNTQSYAAHESDGQLVKLSAMCPTSPVWREKVKEIVTTLFDEYDMDAVYLDQLAAHTPHPCMDKSHSHAPGGGSWWPKAYREMLDLLNAVKPAGKAFTSECNAEVYASGLDGFLGWAWITAENYVPAFMRIYGGKTPCLGRNINGYMKEHPLYWRYHLAQGLVAGEQMGWINSDFVYDEKRLAFAKALVRFRYENRQFFRGARPMRPPVVEAGPEHRFACGIGMGEVSVLQQTYLCAGVLENGSKKMLIAVNLSPEAVSDTIRYFPEEWDPKNYAVSGAGSVEELQPGALRLTVPAESLLALIWEE